MSERLTEVLFLKESKSQIGENPFGFIYEQGDIQNIASIKSCLLKAGGKPKECALDNFSSGGTGRAKPEFIITFNEDHNLIIVVECKSSVKKHASEGLNHPKDFAVDGALYYTKFLKDTYNVIAVAVHLQKTTATPLKLAISKIITPVA